MKTRVVVYCPDELAMATGGERMSEEQRSDLETLSREWFRDGAFLTVEIDTEARTCVVVPVKENA